MSARIQKIGPYVIAGILVLTGIYILSDPLGFARQIGMKNQPGHDLDGLTAIFIAFGVWMAAVTMVVAKALPISGTSHPKVSAIIPLLLLMYAGYILRFTSNAHTFAKIVTMFGGALLVAWWWGPVVGLFAGRIQNYSQ